jgi:hypothetical protein
MDTGETGILPMDLPPVQTPAKRKGRGPTQPRWGLAVGVEVEAGRLYKTPEEAVKAAQEHAALSNDETEELYLVRQIKVTKKVTATLL